MKIKLSQEQIENIVNDPVKAKQAGLKPKDPMWIIILKVIAYIIGLLLGGVVTTSCAGHII